MFQRVLGEEHRKVNALRGAVEARYDEAAWLLDRLVSSDDFVDFLTDPAYDLVSSSTVGREVVAA